MKRREGSFGFMPWKNSPLAFFKAFKTLTVKFFCPNSFTISVSRSAERNCGPRGKNFVWTLWSVVPQNHVMSKKKVIASADVQILARNQRKHHASAGLSLSWWILHSKPDNSEPRAPCVPGQWLLLLPPPPFPPTRRAWAYRLLWIFKDYLTSPKIFCNYFY